MEACMEPKCGCSHNCTCECEHPGQPDHTAVYMYAFERGRMQGRKEGIAIGREQAENDFKEARWKEYESRREV